MKIVFHVWLFKLITFFLMGKYTLNEPNCQINPNCFEGCSDSNCVYDLSKNSFYNKSIVNSTQYSGPYCCDGCNSGYFLWKDMVTCSQTCNYVGGLQTYGNPLTRTCQYICPDLYFGDNTTTNCLTFCPNGSWASFSNNLCLNTCPKQFPFHFTTNNTCLNQCPSGNFTYSIEVDSSSKEMCSSQCPQNLFVYQLNYTCLSVCPSLPIQTYKHLIDKKCQQTCSGQLPYGDFVNEYICVSVCGIDSISKKQKYGNNNTSTCTLQCPNNSFAHDGVKICVQQCFWPFQSQNKVTRRCEAVYKQSQSYLQLIIIIFTSFCGVIMILVFSFLFYRFYLKKKLVRKPFKYDYLNDIQFSS